MVLDSNPKGISLCVKERRNPGVFLLSLKFRAGGFKPFRKIYVCSRTQIHSSIVYCDSLFCVDSPLTTYHAETRDKGAKEWPARRALQSFAFIENSCDSDVLRKRYNNCWLAKSNEVHPSFISTTSTSDRQTTNKMNTVGTTNAIERLFILRPQLNLCYTSVRACIS
jgi:hypothetical protein